MEAVKKNADIESDMLAAVTQAAVRPAVVVSAAKAGGELLYQDQCWIVSQNGVQQLVHVQHALVSRACSVFSFHITRSREFGCAFH